MDESSVADEIKAWCMEEQIFKVKLPAKDNVIWAIELSYPFNHPAPVGIVILQPRKKDFIVLQIAMKMSPQHEAMLKQKGPVAFGLFYHRLKMVLLQKDISYNVDANNNQWIMSDIMHMDGITKHEFFKTIRHLYNAAIMGNMLIEEVLNMAILPAGKAPPKLPPGQKGADDSTGGNLYS